MALQNSSGVKKPDMPSSHCLKTWIKYSELTRWESSILWNLRLATSLSTIMSFTLCTAGCIFFVSFFFTGGRPNLLAVVLLLSGTSTCAREAGELAGRERSERKEEGGGGGDLEKERSASGTWAERERVVEARVAR